MKKAKKIMVAISALAIRAAVPSPASAQVLITCSQNLRFGRVAACAFGSFTVTPSGMTNTAGCAVQTQPGTAARCLISTGGVTPTKDVKVQLTSNFVNINNGGNNARVDKFQLLYTGTATPQTFLTLTPTEVSNGVTVNVGATVEHTKNQPLGSYVGSIRMTVN